MPDFEQDIRRRLGGLLTADTESAHYDADEIFEHLLQHIADGGSVSVELAKEVLAVWRDDDFERWYA